MRGIFSGVYPMLYSFFDADGNLDRTAMRLQVEASIAAGADGIAILGIGGEMYKLDVNEKRRILDWTAEDIAGRVPLSVTISEPNISAQVEFARASKSVNADWIILQPVIAKGAPESAYVRFFGAIAERSDLPVAIQNNSVNLAVWLSNGALNELRRQHGNVSIVKQEGPVTMVQRMIEETSGAFDVFSGLGGRELVDTMLAGCAGVVPVPDYLDFMVEICRLLTLGDAEDIARARQLQANILPLIQFAQHSPEQMFCYGKRLMARRIGIETVFHREPCVQPSDFGLRVFEDLTQGLEPFLTPKDLDVGAEFSCT